MKVIGVNQLIDAKIRYPRSAWLIDGWYRVFKESDFTSQDSLIQAFLNVSIQDNLFSFSLPDNDLVISVLIDFNSQVAIIKNVHTIII